MERLLESFDRAHGLRFVALRYFNAAGATARSGEHHEPETHLIPLALRAAAGRGPKLKVFGRDYDTPDGTAIRDYVHVGDLAEAHLLALAHLRRGGDSQLLNLGHRDRLLRARGDRGGEARDRPRRAVRVGRESARATRRALVADASRARAVLGWTPKQPALDTIVRSAWDWMR